MLVTGVIPYYPQGRQQCLDKAACNLHSAKILGHIQPAISSNVISARHIPVAEEDQRNLGPLGTSHVGLWDQLTQ